jgi:hypothetical protein
MKNNLLYYTLILITLNSCATVYLFQPSEKDADIYVNGKKINSEEPVSIYKNQCVNVKVEKTGFQTNQSSYCYVGASLHVPENKFITLVRDDAYDASVKNDYANKDFEQEIDPKYIEQEAWKIISQIITGYFDNIEMADRETGYLKTSWQTKSFAKITVRTRVIIKQSSSKPLKYRVKIISEYAEGSDQSVKDDDKFKEWDRVLKKYDPLISEFQDRLSVK